MKQKYVKPVVLLERFSLTECIAAGCNDLSNSSLGRPNNSSKANCEWILGDYQLFLTDSSVCDNMNEYKEIGFPHVYEDTRIEGVCYNNPEGATVFGSI